MDLTRPRGVGEKFINRRLVPKLFSKMHFVFHAWAFDDVITFDYWKEFLKWNKNHFSLFHKCSLSDVQNKLANM